MPHVSQGAKLTRVEHILGSGTGTLDFAIEGENDYYTWEGPENANWTAENVKRIENDEEDRLILFPMDSYFTCKVTLGEDGRETIRCE